MNDAPQRPLTPARPDVGDDATGYMPRVPWRWLLLAVATATILVSAYRWNEQSKAQALRAGILRLHGETLRDARASYAALRAALTQRILWAGRQDAVERVQERLSLTRLRASPGLYLRIARSDAQSAESIERAAARATTDVIASCLGLAPLSARGIYERGDFLMPEWADETRQTASVLRLRVIDDDLTRRVRRDLPSVMALVQARWFLLVLEHGPRDSEPVDVFLWDLRDEGPLLSARVRSRGTLISARTRVGGLATGPRLTPADAHRSGAHDCSIAAQIKELAGVRPVEANGPPEVRERPSHTPDP